MQDLFLFSLFVFRTIVLVHQNFHQAFFLIVAQVILARTNQYLQLVVAIAGVVPNQIVACGVKSVSDVRKHIRSWQPPACHVTAERCLCDSAYLAKPLLRVAVFLHKFFYPPCKYCLFFSCHTIPF